MIRSAQLIISTVAIALLIVSPAPAQDPTDLFNLLDSAEIEEESILSKLSSNLGGSLNFRLQNHLTNPATSPGHFVYNQSAFGEARLGLATWTGSDRWRLNIDTWLEAGNGKDIWSGQRKLSDFTRDLNSRRRPLELNEFYLRLYRDSYDLMFGKALFNNGIAPLYSPADRYGPFDYNNPVDSRQLGTWLAQIDYYIGDLTLTGAVLPVYQPIKRPAFSSRWMSNLLASDDPQQAGGAPQDIPEIIPSVRAENMSYLLKAKTTVGGWDLFASAYNGNNYRFVTKGVPTIVTVPSDTGMVNLQTLDISKRIVRVANLAAGFTTVMNKWEFHAEAIYNYSYESKDDNYLNSVVGFGYTIDEIVGKIGLDKIDIKADYARKLTAREQSAEYYIDSTKDTRFSRDTNFGGDDLIARITFTISDDLDLDLVTVKQFTYDGLMVRLIADYTLAQNYGLTLFYDNFSGSRESLFGCWDSNDMVTVTFEYTF
ncbi:hypothetical protein ACFLT7_02915 [candidate division KSB1 bacterium]